MLLCGHFSLAPQFDVSPFGWYNRRMESLRRTGVLPAGYFDLSLAPCCFTGLRRLDSIPPAENRVAYQFVRTPWKALQGFRDVWKEFAAV